MAQTEFFDPIAGEWLHWQALGNNATRVVNNGLGELGYDKISALGACGDPKDPEYLSWRIEELFPILRKYDISVKDDVFNPEVEEWSPMRAPVEGIHLARDKVLSIAVTNKTKGYASITEAGFGAYGGMMRGQDVIVYMQDDKDSPEETQVARRLSRTVLDATEAMYPLFTSVKSIEELAHRSAIALTAKKREQSGGVSMRTEYTLPPIRNDLEPVIYMSGTSGQKKPEWMATVQNTIKQFDAPVEDSYRENWGIGDADAELMKKLGHAVHLIAITSETESFGALSELGPRIMYADLAGQSLGVYIESHDSAPNSAANRTRILAREHLSRLRDDFPNLPVFVAKDLTQLAVFGVSELNKQRQRLER